MAVLEVNAGRIVVTKRILTGGSVFLGWGTGSGTAAATDTDLFSPSSDESRVLCAVSQITTSTTNDSLQITATMTCLNHPKTITNAGIFDSVGIGSPPSGGNLYLKANLTSQSLNVGDAIQISFVVQYS